MYKNTKKQFSTFQFAIILIFAIIFTSCGNRVIYSSCIDISKDGWNKDSIYKFNVEVKDTETMYEIDLLLQNTSDFPRQNLWLSVTKEHNGNILNSDTINIFLIDENGKWQGRGIGAYYDNNFIYKQHIKFDKSGSYIFSIKQLMRCTNNDGYYVLEGIKRIGIEIIKEKR